jgi:murein DD-endopeptidase MepM/ murein hydrolase activator NlpD
LAHHALLKRAPLAVLIGLNVAAAVLVTVDLSRRLAPPARPHGAGAAEVLRVPTMVPAPTARPITPPPSPTPAPPTPSPTPTLGNLTNVLVAGDRFTYEPDFYGGQIQAFLEQQGSVLAQATVPLGEDRDTFAHALAGHCIRYGLNPKVLLALLEIQAGLVRKPAATAEELQWAFGYPDPLWQGLDRQLQWATATLADGFREAAEGGTPVLTDGTLAPIPGEANAATRAILRLLAYTADTERFSRLRSSGAGSFVQTYRELFGEDPRLPLQAPEPADQPFLWPPLSGAAPISSYFDHEYPIFRQNGSLLAYSGERGYQSYDGHDGWDYAVDGGTPVLAAAAGRVAFAGWLDTLCQTPAGLVVVDHGQGYRTLYWHLQSITVAEGTEVGQGSQLGTVGSTGCSSGPHLHLGVQFLGRDTDPYGWCGSSEVPQDPWASHPAGTVSRWLWADRPSPCPVPARAIVVDDQGAQFGQAIWHEAPVGYAGNAFWAATIVDSRQSTHRAVWNPDLPEAGLYYLYAYIPYYDTGRPDTSQARYHVHYSSGEATVVVDQASSTGLWVPLGEFSFAKGARGYVYLDESTGEPDTTVWFDAIVWVKE